MGKKRHSLCSHPREGWTLRVKGIIPTGRRDHPPHPHLPSLPLPGIIPPTARDDPRHRPHPSLPVTGMDPPAFRDHPPHRRGSSPPPRPIIPPPASSHPKSRQGSSLRLPNPHPSATLGHAPPRKPFTMKPYGIAAITAAHECVRNRLNPVTAWADTVQKQFPEKKASREKGCPRGAFLGLCEKGFVRGVPPGDYLRRKPNLNAQYAVEALEFLWDKPSLANDAKELWQRIESAPEAHNGQMDVVVALWEEDLVPRRRPS